MGKFKRLLSLTLVCAISVFVTGCQKNVDQAVNSEYKYGKLKIQALSGAVCGAPAYVAYEKGFFKEEGLDVELVSGTLDENKNWACNWRVCCN